MCTKSPSGSAGTILLARARRLINPGSRIIPIQVWSFRVKFKVPLPDRQGGGLAVPIQEAVGQRPQQIRRRPEAGQMRGRALGELGGLGPRPLDPEY